MLFASLVKEAERRVVESVEGAFVEESEGGVVKPVKSPLLGQPVER